MGINPEAARQLARVGVPIMFGWLGTGFLIAVLYHLSLYYFDGEFRLKNERFLDILASVMRGLLYVLVWPAIFYFDTTAFERIKMLLLFINPKERAGNDELQTFMQERNYRRWVADRFPAQQRLERRRADELATGTERRKRLREIHDGNPELDSIWMLTAVGLSSAGVSELIRLYPDYYLPDEIETKARLEVELRHLQNCVGCGIRVPVKRVEIPELFFLRVLDPQTSNLVAEGWALKGPFRIDFEECQECDAAQPQVNGDVTSFGRAPEVIKTISLGLNYHWDLP